MLRLLLGCALLLPLLGCRDEPTPAERRDALAEQLAGDLVTETGGAIDDEQARCVADELVDVVGVDGFDDIVAAAAAAPGDDQDQLRQEVIDAFEACDALAAVLDQATGSG